jgi:hypothetical protein
MLWPLSYDFFVKSGSFFLFHFRFEGQKAGAGGLALP